ncbi:hypothetical protein [Arthrobacter sp. MMS18-M83]|uniref:hypothetical protein n=1 Tax=Arthrobacter sp. MMS18-M83 TaxID=2996261 RepID=UPI00227CA99F|nr:hypothetical protein [Arthrobacter sp. MMS18-M83]WAH98131.1 hypothetical protein OW521_04415 [Arthrobacter sp. MMS18-M83]
MATRYLRGVAAAAAAVAVHWVYPGWLHTLIRPASRAGLLLLIGLLSGGCTPTQPPTPTGTVPPNSPADYIALLFTYRTDPTSNSITVTAGYGACDTFKSAEAKEQADSVTITITVHREPDSSSTCQIAKNHDITLTLRAPLGTRNVIAAGGETIATAKPTP